MMTSELYWQLVGRIGRYEDSTVHLFSYIDDSGNVLRNKMIMHTPFIVPNEYLLDRIILFEREKSILQND